MNGNTQRSRVTVDTEKNRLIITVKGNVCKRELESIYTDVRFGVADLKPGFQVITNMTEARIGYLSGITVFKKIADFLSAAGVGTVVRVVGKPSIISKQILQLAEMVQGYHPVHVATIEEAEALLDETEPVSTAAAGH